MIFPEVSYGNDMTSSEYWRWSNSFKSVRKNNTSQVSTEVVRRDLGGLSIQSGLLSSSADALYN